VILYNLLLLAADIVALGAIRARPTFGRWIGVSAALGFLALGIAMFLGRDRFECMRFFAVGLFGHLALLLLLATVLLYRKSKGAALLSGIAALALWGVAIDAFLIEPAWIEVTHYRIESEKLTERVRVVVVADLQTDRFTDYERSVLELAAQQQPDLLLFAGDYVQADDPDVRGRIAGQIRDCLAGLDFGAAEGSFAVRGNVDGDQWRRMFEGTDITADQDAVTRQLDNLTLTSLGWRDSFDPRAIITNPEGRFHLVLGHAPDFALGQVDADLLIAGHTHGGQVQMPLVGPLLVLSRVPRAWGAGLTPLPTGGRLFVSRGVGMERGHAPRLRFFCRPELAVLELVPE